MEAICGVTNETPATAVYRISGNKSAIRLFRQREQLSTQRMWAKERGGGNLIGDGVGNDDWRTNHSLGETASRGMMRPSFACGLIQHRHGFCLQEDPCRSRLLGEDPARRLCSDWSGRWSLSVARPRAYRQNGGRGEPSRPMRNRNRGLLDGPTVPPVPHFAETRGDAGTAGDGLRLSPTMPSKPFSTLYIEKIPFSIAPAAFSKWSSKIENATGFLYI
jgi:hypothetical protein